MSNLFGVRETQNHKNTIRKIEVESQPGTVRPNIVCIGDPIPDADLLGIFLEEMGLQKSSRGARARAEKSPDLVILNFNHLTFDAQQKVRRAKSRYRAPVICIFPSADAEKVALIGSLGAEDYLFKPFNPHDLACRIGVVSLRHKNSKSAPAIDRRTQLRRGTDGKRLNNIVDVGSARLQIDNEKKQVRLGDRSISLTPTEYRLFCLLASEAGRVFPADEIISHLWKNRQRASVGDVQQYVYLLRKKVEFDVKQPKWVVTVKGFGYKLDVAND